MSSDDTTSISSQFSAAENAEERLTRHSVYYFDPVVFRVEGVIFNVPKYGFMVPGSMFHDMFSLPTPEGGQAEGTDANPIQLAPDITQQEFFGFLFVMYPFLGHAACNEINYKELVGALKLATIWQFSKIRSCAIHLLSPLFEARHPVDILLVAWEYRSRSLLRQGYVTLIEKNVTIETLRNPYKLDWETISGILSAKTRFSGGVGTSIRYPCCSTSSNSSEVTVNCEFHIFGAENCVDIMFKEELEKMDQEYYPEVDHNYIKKNYGLYLSQRSNVDRSAEKEGESVDTVPEAETSILLVRRHHVYYIETIPILVEHTFFRLPKDDLERIFDKIPPEMSVQSFSRFLTAFYPQIDHERNLVNYDEWMDVLHLSTLWGFYEIREKAITMLSPLIRKRNSVETVLTARRYKVRAWMQRALEKIANRSPKPTMVQELREPFELDWETIAKILSIQIQSFEVPAYLKRPHGYCPECKTGSIKKSCQFSCKKLQLPFDEEGEATELRSSAVTDKRKAMVIMLFEEETIDWP